MQITPLITAEANHSILGTSSKKLALPENLEFQPQKFLNIKQSIYIEKRLGVAGDMNSISEAKNVLKAKLKQKQIKTRIQLLQQQVFLHFSTFRRFFFIFFHSLFIKL